MYHVKGAGAGAARGAEVQILDIVCKALALKRRQAEAGVAGTGQALAAMVPCDAHMPRSDRTPPLAAAVRGREARRRTYSDCPDAPSPTRQYMDGDIPWAGRAPVSAGPWDRRA